MLFIHQTNGFSIVPLGNTKIWTISFKTNGLVYDYLIDINNL